MKDIEIGDLDIGDLSIGRLSIKSEKERLDEFKQIPDLTENCKEELGVQLQKIREFEKKFRDEWEFDGDNGFYFSICFRSEKERKEFCRAHKIKLVHDDHVMYEDIKHVFREV